VDSEAYDEIIRHLLRIAAHQDTINTEMRAMFSTHGALIERLTTAIERLDTTLARIETLLARLLRHEDNGREGRRRPHRGTRGRRGHGRAGIRAHS
jgi:predicted transcriptional regulator